MKPQTCKQCNRQFSGYRRPGTARYCSRACWRVGHASKAVYYDGPCLNCGRRCSVEEGRRRYTMTTKTCSFKCMMALRTVTRSCRRCATTFTCGRRSGRQYCSGRCYHSAISERALAEERIVKCEQCGRQIVWRLKARDRRFCSRECARIYSVGERAGNWRGGASLHRGRGWSRIADTIRERDNRRCRRCGKTEAENKQKLSVDHVRPWREFANERDANDERNLVSLCRSCHGKKLKLESAWLRGDGLALMAYRKSVGLPTDGLGPVETGPPTGPPRMYGRTKEQRIAQSAAKKQWWARPENRRKMAGAADKGWATRRSAQSVEN